MPAEHHNWNRMPKREERIPMMGQGFSRMLMTINHQSSVLSAGEDPHGKTYFTPRIDDTDDDPLSQSRHEKRRNSISRIEKQNEGSTTIEASVLPQINKKIKTKKK